MTGTLVAIVAGLLGGWVLTRVGALPMKRRRVKYASVESAASARQGQTVPLDESRGLLKAAFRTEEIPDPEDARREDQLQLARALADVADVHGADLAVLWSVPSGDDATPAALAWSDGDPAPVLTSGQRNLAVWTARESMLSFDRASDAPRFAAAPVQLFGLAGVLTLHLRDDGRVSRESLKGWLPRHAQAIGAMHELLRTRAEVARSNFRLRASVRSAIKLQGTRDPLELESTLVTQALDVVSAEWAMLVRWDREKWRGEIRATTREPLPPEEEREVLEGSRAGDVCLDGTPIVFVDTRTMGPSDGAVFDRTGIPEDTRALLIVPLRRGKEARPIGALVCGHSAVGAFTQADARIAQELGIVASGALETAWAVNAEREVARTDPLTGLANRRKFDEHFARAIEWTDRHPDTSMALALVDLDFFKKVNDTFGHEAGDAVLVAVSKALQKDRRALDTVARLGGEELALLLPSTTMEGAHEVAERVRARIEAMEIATSAGLIRVTASFGVAIYRSRAGDQGEVFERADQALYAAKRAGRNRVELASN